MFSSRVRIFYASGARMVLLVGTKFVCKVATIIALALWRDAPPSSFCRWYLPVDGAVLLWQAHVAPVGAAAQVTIAAVDAACTFCCCWLLSDRWPYDRLSAGTVLAVQLLLASASLWLAERTERSDRRDFERAVAAKAALRDGAASLERTAATAAADTAGAGVGPENDAAEGKSPRYMRAAPACCGVQCCGCGCGSGEGGDADAYADAGSRCDGGRTGAPAPQPAQERQQQQQHLSPQQWLPREGSRSLDECCCLARLPMSYTGGAGASGAGVARAGVAGPGGGSCSSGSTAAVAATACSEDSSPTTLSDVRSLSRALPSFSTMSSCSTLVGAAGSISAAGLTETSGSSPSRSMSRPSSCCVGGLLAAGRAPGQTQSQSSQTAPSGRALAAVAAAAGPTATDRAQTSPSRHVLAITAGTRTSQSFTEAVGVDADAIAAASSSAAAAPSGAATGTPASAAPPPPAAQSVGHRSDAKGGSSPAVRGMNSAISVFMDETGVASALGDPMRTTEAHTPCGEEGQAHADGGGSAVPTGTPTTSGPIAVAYPTSPVPTSGAGPLRQLQRLVQNLVARSDAVAEAAAAKQSDSGETSASGTASTTSGPVSGCSSISRTSEPRLCSDPSSQESISVRATVAAAIAAAAGVCGRSGAAGQPRRLAMPAGAGVEAAQGRPCCGPAGSSGTRAVTRASAGAIATPDGWGCTTAVAAGGSHLLVSADCVLAHPQPASALASVLAGALAQAPLQQPHPLRDIAFSALSADTVSPAQQQRQRQQQPHNLLTERSAPARQAGQGPVTEPAEEAGRTDGSPAAVADAGGAAANSAAGAVVVGSKTTMGPLVTAGTTTAATVAAAPVSAAAPAARASTACDGDAARQPPAFRAPAAARYVTGDRAFNPTTISPSAVSPFSTMQATVMDAADSRTPRCYALARALTARGGSNAAYGTPALQHARCSIKLGGLSPSDLPHGFVERVASVLASAGGAAAAGQPLAALAAVGVYVREGCVELVADVLVPTGAAEAEALVAGLAARVAAANARGPDGGRGAGGAGAAALSRLLAVAEDVAAAAQRQPPPQQQPEEAAAQVMSPDRAAAEAMLDLLERALLPQIAGVVSPASAQGAAGAPSPRPEIGAVGMQATVGEVQAMSWLDPRQLAMPAAAAPPPPPPAIVCVTPCCVTLNQVSADDTRDRRRQTLTLTVALAGYGVSVDAVAPPRLFVRHSGRCLAAVVRPCAERYAGCLAVTVELALSGLRPGLVFVEAAAAAAPADGAAAGVLSLPWPVLVIGDARVAAEVVQLQQQLEATAPLRAVQAEAELLQYMRQQQTSRNSSSDSDMHPQLLQQRQLPGLHAHHPQRQLDDGTTSLLLDFGLWFEAVSAADTTVVAAIAAAAAVTAPAGLPVSGGHNDAAAATRPAPSLPAAQPAEMAAPQPPQPLSLLLTPPVTASAVEEGDVGETQAQEVVNGDHMQQEEEQRQLLQERYSSDGSSWESLDDDGDDEAGLVGERGASASAVAASSSAPAGAPSAQRLTRPKSPLPTAPAAVDAAEADAEVQMLLLRGLQPEQDLLDGSLDCAAEYEQTCRQGPALQSAAAGLGMRLLRFAVVRGWPAASTLLLRGLTVHCRMAFPELLLLFPAAIGGGAAGMPLLHAAVMSGSLAMVRAVKAWAQRYRCALPWDEPVAAAGGLTPLHLAAVQENGRLAGAILGLWPDAEAMWAVARDRDGRTPQEYAYMRAMSGSSSAASSAAASLSGASGMVAAPAAAAAASSAAEAMIVAPLQQAGPQQPQPQEWSAQAREIEETLAEQQQPRAARSQHGQQQPLRLLQQQQSQRALGLAEAAAAAAVAASLAGGASSPLDGRPYVFAVAQRPPRPPSPMPVPEAAAGSSDSGGTVGTASLAAAAAAAAAGGPGMRADGPGSSTSSVFMTSIGPVGACAGSGFGRFERTSDCGSMSVGPDSQWSHSTNTTALTHYNHQPTGVLQDLRSPVQVAGGQHSLNATLLSLANLPDGCGSSCSSGGGGGTAAAAAAVRGGVAAIAGASASVDACTTSICSGNNSGGSGDDPVHRQLLALASRHQLRLPQQQLQLQPQHLHQHVQSQQQPRQQTEPAEAAASAVRAPFKLEMLSTPAVGPAKAAPHPPVPSPQLQQMLKQQQQQQQVQQMQMQPFSPHPHAAPAEQVPHGGSGGVPVGTASPPGQRPEPPSPPPPPQQLLVEHQHQQHSRLDRPLYTRHAGPQPVAALTLDGPGAQVAHMAGAAAAPGVHTAAAAAVDDGSAAAQAVGPSAARPQAAAVAAKPPTVAQPSQNRGDGPTVALPTATPAPSRLSTRSVRVLATTLLVDGGRGAASPPRTSSPPGSTGSRSSAAAAAATATYSTRSTAISATSAQSFLSHPAAAAGRRHPSGDGRFSANTRRTAFADDYAPACQPSLAARTSHLAGLLPLLSTAQRHHALGGAADQLTPGRAAPLAEARAAVVPPVAAAATAACAATSGASAAASAAEPAARHGAVSAAVGSGAAGFQASSGGGGGVVGNHAQQLERSRTADVALEAPGAEAQEEEEERPLKAGVTLAAVVATEAAQPAPLPLPLPAVQVRAQAHPPRPPARADAGRSTATGVAPAVDVVGTPWGSRRLRLQSQLRGGELPMPLVLALLAGLVLLVALALPAVTTGLLRA